MIYILLFIAIIMIAILSIKIMTKPQIDKDEAIKQMSENMMSHICNTTSSNTDYDTDEEINKIKEEEIVKNAINSVISSYVSYFECDYIKNLSSLSVNLKKDYDDLSNFINSVHYSKQVYNEIKDSEEIGDPLNNDIQNLLATYNTDKMNALIFSHYSDVVNNFREYWEDVISELMMKHAKIRRREYISDQIVNIVDKIQYPELRDILLEYKQFNEDNLKILKDSK